MNRNDRRGGPSRGGSSGDFRGGAPQDARQSRRGRDTGGSGPIDR